MSKVAVNTWESFSDLYGEIVPMDKIVDELKLFSRPSVLMYCSYITVALQLGMRGEELPKDRYFELIDSSFDSETAQLIKDRSSSESRERFVFHRRLILLLAKLALLHCEEAGMDALQNKKQFGVLFLKVNDHFDYRELFPTGFDTNSRQGLLAILANALTMKEFSNGRFELALVRIQRMCITIASRLTAHPDYIDIDELLRNATGLNYALLEALTIGLSLQYKSNERQPLLSTPFLGLTFAEHLTGGVLSVEQVQLFMRQLSGNMDQLVAEARKAPSRNNDLSLFRKFPLMRLAIELKSGYPVLAHLLFDQGFVFQKVSGVPYWTGVEARPDSFQRFWGALFEAYVGEIWEEVCRGTRATYIHSPKLASNDNEEICDGLIVDGDTVVLLEYKSSIFTAKAKYSGNIEELEKELKRKLVRNEKNSPKAAIQLATAVKKFFSASDATANPWFDRRKIKTCYAALITLDDIGGASAISTLLSIDFRDALSGSKPICEVRPLFCLDIESLEIAGASYRQIPFAQMLERWFVQDPLLLTPLSRIQFDDAATTIPEWLHQREVDLCTRVARTLIAPDRLAASPDYQQHLKRSK